MLPKGVYTMILILPVVSVIAYCFGYITTSGIIGCIAAILSVTLFFNNKWFLIAFAGITGISGAFLPQKEGIIPYTLHLGTSASIALLLIPLISLLVLALSIAGYSTANILVTFFYKIKRYILPSILFIFLFSIGSILALFGYYTVFSPAKEVAGLYLNPVCSVHYSEIDKLNHKNVHGFRKDPSRPEYFINTLMIIPLSKNEVTIAYLSVDDKYTPVKQVYQKVTVVPYQTFSEKIKISFYRLFSKEHLQDFRFFIDNHRVGIFLNKNSDKFRLVTGYIHPYPYHISIDLDTKPAYMIYKSNEAEYKYTIYKNRTNLPADISVESFYSEYVPKSQEDILKKEKDDKEMVKRDVDEILAGINPFKVNEDLRTVPTGNTTLHNK